MGFARCLKMLYNIVTMMFFILDKNPKEAVKYLVENAPRVLKCKQLLELGQLICSCGYSDVYKKVQQGKEIQKWIKKNVAWVSAYYGELLKYCLVDSATEATKHACTQRLLAP